MSDRAAYFHDYYQRTAERRKKLARDRKQSKRWCAWLLGEIRAHVEPVQVVNVLPVMPVRRPILSLRGNAQ